MAATTASQSMKSLAHVTRQDALSKRHSRSSPTRSPLSLWQIKKIYIQYLCVCVCVAVPNGVQYSARSSNCNHCSLTEVASAATAVEGESVEVSLGHQAAACCSLYESTRVCKLSHERGGSLLYGKSSMGITCGNRLLTINACIFLFLFDYFRKYESSPRNLHLNVQNYVLQVTLQLRLLNNFCE